MLNFQAIKISKVESIGRTIKQVEFRKKLISFRWSPLQCKYARHLHKNETTTRETEVLHQTDEQCTIAAFRTIIEFTII